MPPEGRRIEIQGTVQGVGFRPWVFRLATALGLTGWVRNDSAGVTIEVFGEAADDQLGSVVAPGGDLDHDGVPDLLLGAPGSASSAGLVDVLLSASAGDWSPAGVTPDARIAGNAMTDRVGEALAGGLDLEGDGFGEVALGAAHADAAISEGGAVYVFSGRSAMR